MTLTLLENKPKRRDQLVIMAEIVDIARRGSSKTNIMFKANLSFSQLNQYLSILTQVDLLEKCSINRKEMYKATQKGYEFMQKQYQVIKLLNSDQWSSVKTSSFDNFFLSSQSSSPEILTS